MQGVNKAILLGNLGADPQVKYTPSGTAVAMLSVATNRTFKDRNGEKQERTEWHRVVLWQRLAEIAGEYLKKGATVYIEGELQTRQWEKDGETRYSTEIVAREMRMVSGAKDGGSKKSNAPTAEDSTQITDEDIPF